MRVVLCACDICVLCIRCVVLCGADVIVSCVVYCPSFVVCDMCVACVCE